MCSVSSVLFCIHKRIKRVHFKNLSKPAEALYLMWGMLINYNSIFNAKPKNDQYTYKYREPYAESNEALSATHCILDSKKSKLSSADRSALEKANVWCVNVMFLQSYITADLVPNPKEFLYNN